MRTANLLDVVSRLPTRGLVANMSGLSGDRGSILGGQCWYKRYAPRPEPPMNWRNTISGKDSHVTSWLLRWMISIFPL